jgi:hypothetical protein
MDKYNVKSKQSIRDPDGTILFYVGFERDAASIDSIVLWDAMDQHLGSCGLAVDGRVGGQVISDSRFQMHAVVQAQVGGLRADASQRFTLQRLTPGGSWRLACSEHFRPVWVYDEDDHPVAQMVLEGTGYQLFISPNTDVCMLILFIFCCERLYVMASEERSSPKVVLGERSSAHMHEW